MSSSNRRRSSLGMDATRFKIEQMEADRERRRQLQEQTKKDQQAYELQLRKAGNTGNVDFIGLVEEWRASHEKDAKPHALGESHNICICVRKRPMSEKEYAKQDHDSITALHPKVWIHTPKLKVDGITKYLDHSSFQLDHVFSEDVSTQELYLSTALPLVDFCLQGSGKTSKGTANPSSSKPSCPRSTMFCYGQTGSGKTFTMNGIQTILVQDLFSLLEDTSKPVNLETTSVHVAFFELYGGFIQDLLHERKRCKLLEDRNGQVQIKGLQEVTAESPQELFQVLQKGNALRTTHATQANDTSSRSHAICQILLRSKTSSKRQQPPPLVGKLSLVDLAGSERGVDTTAHNTQRRTESAEINTSLLSLKECIRALGNGGRVPYRQSKLTLLLKDCFTEPESKTTMIATVSPGASATDHSLNTLRYADRIKEHRSSTTAGRGVTKKSNSSNKSKAQIQAPSQARIDRILQTSAEMTLAASSDEEQEEDNLLEVQSSLTKSTDGDAMLLEALASEESSLVGEQEDEALPTDIVESSLNQVVSTDTMLDEHDNDEEELRRTVQKLLALEEDLLNQHMHNIQENAELLTAEGKLLQVVQNDPSRMDDYAVQLADVLDRKEFLLSQLHSKMMEFQQLLGKEQELAQRVTQLSQY